MHFSDCLDIPIKHRLIYQQRASGMSRLHLDMMCLDRWQSVCSASTNSMSKRTWWERRKLKHTVHFRLGYTGFGGVFLALEACLGWNNSFIISRSMSRLASYKSKNDILDLMADLSYARTEIRGQIIPSCASCSLAMNTSAVSLYPTLRNADLRCARTSMIFQRKLQLW